jgi:hypothetical protein
MLLVACHQTPKTQKVIVDLSRRVCVHTTSRERSHDYTPKPGASQRMTRPRTDPVDGHSLHPSPQHLSARFSPPIQELESGATLSPQIFGNIGRVGRTRQPVWFVSPTDAANANLKAPSRAQPAGVRVTLTSLPFHLRSDLLCLFPRETVLPSQRLRSDKNDSMNGRSAPAPSPCGLIETVHLSNCPYQHIKHLTLLTQCRNFRAAFPLLALFSSLVCAIARTSSRQTEF